MVAVGVSVLVVVATVAAWKPLARALYEDVRVEIWRGTWGLIQQHLFFGAGSGAFAAEYPPFRTATYFEKEKAAFFTDHAHNEWLETWAETGLLGVLTFAAVFLYAAIQWWRRREQMRPQNWAFALATIALLAHGTVEVSLRHPPGKFLVWLAVGLSLSGLPFPRFEWRLPPMLERAFLVLGVFALVIVPYEFVSLPVSAELQWRRALVAQDAGNLFRAADELEGALQKQPHNIEYVYQLAVVLERSATDDDRLGEVLQRLHRLAPDYRSVNMKLGLWHYRRGRIAEAIPFLEREIFLELGDPSKIEMAVVPAKPEIANAFASDLCWLAGAYLDADRRDEAWRTLNKARTLLRKTRDLVEEELERDPDQEAAAHFRNQLAALAQTKAIVDELQKKLSQPR